MGNNQTFIIPENYAEFTHKGLAQASLTPKKDQLQIVFQKGHSNKFYTDWMTNLLLFGKKNKFLFLPEIQLCQDHLDICCSPNDLYPTEDLAKAIYDPYIYTLRRQILMRKNFCRIFHENQIWKFLKAGTIALRDWEAAYPDLSIGIICPENVLMNYRGQIKFVNLHSFPSQDNAKYQYETYIPPEKRHGAVIKYAHNSPQNKHTMASIYSLGKVLLATVFRQLDYSVLTINERKNHVEESKSYHSEVKQLIFRMVEQDISLRPTLYQLQQALKRYQEVTKLKEEAELKH